MKSLNQVTLIGHVASDPEVKVVNSKGVEVKVARLSLATSTGGYTKKDGTQVPENTQFHRIVVWRGDAEYVEKYIHKGDVVSVVGSIEYSEAVIGADGKVNRDINAQGVKVRYTDITADEVILCHSKNGIQQEQPQGYSPYPPQGQQYQPQPQQYPPQQYQPQNQQYPPQYPQNFQQYPQGYQQQPNNAPF